MPTIIYADENSVIMYDYIGIWVYDLKKEELTGFCDFRPINMTQIQGHPCVFVEATEDGKYVKFYVSYSLDFSRENDVLRYRDLVILVEKEMGLQEFRPFEVE